MPFPDGDLQRIDRDLKVDWDSRVDRYNFKNEWYDRGYGDLPLPWEAYDIHHILPKEFESIMNSPLTLRQLNTFDRRRFVAALASLFEGPPWIVDQAWQGRPFSSLTDLHRALCEVMMQAPVEQQVALIQAHPDLVGRRPWPERSHRPRRTSKPLPGWTGFRLKRSRHSRATTRLIGSASAFHL